MAQNKSHHVPNGKNQKQLILECSREEGFERVGARELRTLQAAVRRRMGNGHQVSPSYIANVLRQAGVRVEVDDPFVDPWMEEPYASRLAGLLQFGDLEEAESSLRKLDEIFRQYRAVADRQGTDLIRTLIVKGKQRAESMAANPRIRPEKRREKQEIARWFRVWMDVSDLCFDWIEMRKESEEFQQTFGGRNGHRAVASQEN